MSPKRAPLFSVSMAFALGCVLGLDGGIGVRTALVLAAVAGALWLALRRWEAVALAAFYALIICGGLAHTLIVARIIASEDLRRLPDAKLLETTQWRGTLAEEPQSQYTPHASRRALDRTSFVFHVEAWRTADGRLFSANVDAPWQSATGDVACTILGPANELRCGDELEFAAALEPVRTALCPGEFNSRDSDARRGIFYEAAVMPLNWRCTATGGSDWLERLSFAARDWAYDRLRIGIEDDPRTADFLAGMLIGYRRQIPPDIEQDFRRTGTIHIFAVSGQKIADMFIVALVLLQLAGLVRWRWAWIVAPLLLLYCLLTGSPAAAVRATVTLLGLLLAWRLGRPLNALACWSVVFLVLVAWNPPILLDPGAQLSFALVLSLILIAPSLIRWFMKPIGADPFLPRSLWSAAQKGEYYVWRRLVLLLSCGVAAVLVCEPITAVDFHQVTPISILANLVVFPLAGLITCIGTMSVLVSLLNTTLAALLNNSNWLLAKILIWFVHLLAHQPGAMINVPDVAALESPQPAFVVAPVRDSACLLVRTGSGGAWLVNAGRETPGPSPVWHFLQFYGINRLDGLVLAQMSAPDNSGVEAIVRDFRPHRLVVPVLRSKSPLEKEMAEMAVATNDPPETWAAGQEIDLGGSVRAEVLRPAPDSAEGHVEDRGLVLLFHLGDRTLLWAGRIGAAAQVDLLAAHPGLHADVLVMGTEPAPDVAWLSALQVRDWLQIPPRDEHANITDVAGVPDFCQVWRLNQTGAVDIHFKGNKIFLRPWVALPNP